MACISLVGVSHTYPGGIKAVNDLNLEVLDGELLVLLGPSGCGKSTTLRLIAGLESPESGEIRLRDRGANRLPPHDRDVAMLFQEEALYPHLSVRDNLGFSLQARRRGWLRWRRDPQGASALVVRQRVLRAAHQLGLVELLERRPGELSGGERQRVALGRVLVRDAGVWLLDEPFAHVDARLRAELRRTLQAIHRERRHATIVYVTHDQAEALSMADRVAVMNQGRLEQIGAPRELCEDPRNMFVAGFVGDPPMNLARGEIGRNAIVQGAGWTWQMGEADNSIDGTAGRKLVIGLRPQQLALTAINQTPAGVDLRMWGEGKVVGREWRSAGGYTAVALDNQATTLNPSDWWWVQTRQDEAFRVGDRVRIWARGRANWFDEATGIRI